jgi:hypothetical protein
MQKDLRPNHSLINLSPANSSVNSTNTSFCAKEGHQLIVRRKVSALPIPDRRRKSGNDSQGIAVRYIPLTRVCTEENSISLPVSRQNSKENLHSEAKCPSSHRFQRHSERIFHHFTSPSSPPEPETCKVPTCLE